jgi:hypothetical protein
LSTLRVTSIYRETFARCSKASHDGQFKSEVRAIWEGFSFKTTRESASQGLQVVGMDPAAIAMTIQNRVLTEHTSETLNAPEFYQALNDCYGDKISLKNAYVAGLVTSDVAGKVAVIGATIAAGWITMKVVGTITVAYPMLWYGLMSVAGSATVYQSYRSIHEVLRDPSASESAAAKAMINNPVAANDVLVANTEELLRLEIRDLKRQLPGSKGDRRAHIQRRIVSLSSHFDQLQALDNSNHFVKG